MMMGKWQILFQLNALHLSKNFVLAISFLEEVYLHFGNKQKIEKLLK